VTLKNQLAQAGLTVDSSQLTFLPSSRSQKLGQISKIRPDQI